MCRCVSQKFPTKSGGKKMEKLKRWPAIPVHFNKNGVVGFEISGWHRTAQILLKYQHINAYIEAKEVKHILQMITNRYGCPTKGSTLNDYWKWWQYTFYVQKNNNN